MCYIIGMNINFSALKAKFLPSRETGSVNEIPFKEMDILDHIEQIVEFAKNHGIDKCQVTGKKHINHVADKLGIKPAANGGVFILYGKM